MKRWFKAFVCRILGHNGQTYWGWPGSWWCDRCGLTQTPEVIEYMKGCNDE